MSDYWILKTMPTFYLSFCQVFYKDNLSELYVYNNLVMQDLYQVKERELLLLTAKFLESDQLSKCY